MADKPRFACRWEKLNLVRVYTKPKGRLPDYSQPVVLRSNRCTVEDFVSSDPSGGNPTSSIPVREKVDSVLWY